MENHTVVKAAIRNVVSRGIRDIRRDPHRSIRRLVDLGIQFGRGQNQQTFFLDAHSALKNPRSPYYQLVTSLTHNVDLQTLETLGLNVGYMSWTMGAKVIRAYEKENGVNIPWTLLVDTGRPQARTFDFLRLVEEGQRLGIYTYFLFVGSGTGSLAPWLAAADRHRNSAFFLFSQDATANDQLASLEAALCNVLIVPRGGVPGVESLLASLAQKRRMFGLNCEYNASKVDWLFSDDFLRGVAEQGYPFLFFLPASDCDAQTRSQVNARVVAMRSALKYPFFPIDLYRDIREVDHIISQESCLLALSADGSVLYPPQSSDIAFPEVPLEALLRQTMPAVRRYR